MTEIENLLFIAKKLSQDNVDLTMKNIRSFAKLNKLSIKIAYYNIIKILQENGYVFKQSFDKNNFANRRIEMAKLTRKGWTLQMIGDKYSITRQAVSLLLKKAAAKDNQIVLKNKTGNCADEENVIRTSRSKKYKRSCKVCKKQFDVKSNQKNKKTCSDECFKKSLDLRSGGEWSRKEKVILCCEFCHKVFSRTNYIQKIISIKKGTSNNNYCSRFCYHESRKTTKQGCENESQKTQKQEKIK